MVFYSSPQFVCLLEVFSLCCNAKTSLLQCKVSSHTLLMRWSLSLWDGWRKKTPGERCCLTGHLILATNGELDAASTSPTCARFYPNAHSDTYTQLLAFTVSLSIRGLGGYPPAPQPALLGKRLRRRKLAGRRLDESSIRYRRSGGSGYRLQRDIYRAARPQARDSSTDGDPFRQPVQWGE